MPSNLPFLSSDSIFATDLYGESNGVNNDTPSSLEDREKDPFLSEVIFHLSSQVEFKDLEILPSRKNNEEGFSEQTSVEMPDQNINFYEPRLSDVDKKTSTKKNVKRGAEEMEGAKGIGNEQSSHSKKSTMIIIDNRIREMASILPMALRVGQPAAVVSIPQKLRVDQPQPVVSRTAAFVCDDKKLKELGFNERQINMIKKDKNPSTRISKILENIQALRAYCYTSSDIKRLAEHGDHYINSFVKKMHNFGKLYLLRDIRIRIRFVRAPTLIEVDRLISEFNFSSEKAPLPAITSNRSFGF